MEAVEEKPLRSPTNIDADLLETPRSRGTGRATVARMEGRVLAARAMGTALVEQRARALAQSDFDLYMADLIDEETLRQRKAEARKKAMDKEGAPYNPKVSTRSGAALRLGAR